MENREASIEIEVVYALPEHRVSCGCAWVPRNNSGQAVGAFRNSPIYFRKSIFPKTNWAYSAKLVKPDRILRDRDRVEIYRPWPVDPKGHTKARSKNAARYEHK